MGRGRPLGRPGGRVADYLRTVASFRTTPNGVFSLKAMELGRQGWERYFATQGIAPLRIDYDEVVEDHDGVCRRILEAVDPTADHSMVPPDRIGVRRQADSISDEWPARFVADEGGDVLPGS